MAGASAFRPGLPAPRLALRKAIGSARGKFSPTPALVTTNYGDAGRHSPLRHLSVGQAPVALRAAAFGSRLTRGRAPPSTEPDVFTKMSRLAREGRKRLSKSRNLRFLALYDADLALESLCVMLMFIAAYVFVWLLLP